MANCVYHPGKTAIGACVSCFTLVCKECSTEVDGNIYCLPCVGEDIKGAVKGSGQVRTKTGFLVSGNTSGQGKRAEIPPDIRAWNWGAFWGTWIWGLANRVWISLLYPLPNVLGIILVALFMSNILTTEQLVGIAQSNIWRFMIFLLWVMQIVLQVSLLLKGNQWAWRAKRWESVQSFLTVQKRWTYFFLAMFVILFIVFFILPLLFIITMSGLITVFTFF